ncbi:MAG: biotin-dependent carboxyltransferase family protein [Candidatus Bathyarchaeales archaeon]
MKVLRVIKPGFFTTVQDLGRHGFLRFGVPVSGAMDKYAFTCANVLVGNQANCACLEVTLIGPELEALNDAQIAVAGADFLVTVNRASVPLWRTLNIKKGDKIAFVGSARKGCRAYLAVRGGIDVPVVLGSRSTYVRGGYGGIEGRVLKRGDLIHAFESHTHLETKIIAPSNLIPSYEKEFTVNVVLGPQEDMFTNMGIETFFSSTYTVTIESDRMGYRLDGATIERKVTSELVTDPLIPGAVQVLGNGKPAVLMADAQTSGGYPKIATVTSAGVSRLAQARPGDLVRFVKVSLTQARAEFLEFSRVLSEAATRSEQLF